ncbi:monosaccharide ABC transporter substrate-binding protein, CUT2 family [Faunimonas pinastri]|uniref:Monosaccharide ABC transporter substrate-binding protein, CUT2 family n=1 Tax=Faunimonas pinastri TaxID=1855383 RepID=A0A1H9EKB5_9HYPH|nr:substrate-binding domain-containing protein [Faunimonas pinastri]SEQ25448.1 monosaccharide ABC transporter substrate-binding protein, CUT2 family [Faunimonas pinastri]
MTWKTSLLTAAALAGFTVIGAVASASADDLSYFSSKIEPLTKKPSFEAPGPAFDAAACMKGKSILSIPVSSANPFTANIEKAMQAAAKKVGFKFTTWENQGQSSQWVQGMDTAVNQKYDLIDLLAGSDPRVLVPQVQAARAAKIPVIASHYSGMEQTAEVMKYADGDVPIDYAKAGGLLVDWAVTQTKGHMNALILISTGPLSTDSMMSGMKAELAHCADCKSKVMNFAVPDWGTRITPAVQSALLADPTINYIIVMYDSMSQFVVPAVTITGAQSRVKVDAFNGTPFVLGLVQNGQVEMDIGENLDWIGHALLDSEMRRLCGLPVPKDPKIPFYLFNKDNAKDAGTPPQLSKGYGDAYVQGYNDLWKLK